MNIELRRQRKLDQLLGDAFSLYWRNLAVLLGTAAAVIVPAHAIVGGIGLESFTREYQDDPDTARTAIQVALGYLVLTPLVTAMTIHVLRQAAQGTKARFGETIRAGFDVFTPLFLAVLVAAAGIALGFFLLILPGVYLAVKLLFVPQAVVIEGERGWAALQRSFALTDKAWWRTAGIALAINVIALVPSAIVGLPFELAAKELDTDALTLAGTAVGQLIAAPFVAAGATLLFYDLLSRKEGAQRP